MPTWQHLGVERNDWDAVVVGSGPNGLAAAITVARAGRSVLVLEASSTPGGGARSAELTGPGFVHDVCSAILPLGVGSPFFASLPLARHGLEWVHPEIPVAHPLDGGRGAVAHRDLGATTAALGDDGARYGRLIGGLVDEWPRLVDHLLGPILRFPRHPVALARFGLPALLPARTLGSRVFRDEPARALFAGNAAHSILPLSHPLTASFGLLLLACAHAIGWPVARGGTQSLTDALVAHLTELGGELRVDHPVRSLADVPPSRVVLFDTTPGALARIAGDALPARHRARLERFRHGPGAFKIDYALSEPVPWAFEPARRAGTVHVGGAAQEVAAAEADVAAGRHPERPFLLVGQQSLVDRTRAPDGRHTLWVYCHVPAHSTFDMTAAIEAQLERFAPGFQDVVLARAVRTPLDLERENESYVGGDISGGAHSGAQLLFRPVVQARPYATPNPRLWLCSASAPPGAGVHGMCGFHAATAALAHAFG